MPEIIGRGCPGLLARPGITPEFFRIFSHSSGSTDVTCFITAFKLVSIPRHSYLFMLLTLSIRMCT
jgi:hypothetical protein